MVSNKCVNISFPNHPQRRFRLPCNATLMKTVIGIDGKKIYLYPKKVYCSRSIKASIEELLKRPGFKDVLHKGPVCSQAEEMTDVCDGEVYKTFCDDNGLPFFREKRNIGLMLNVDWFNPFKNSEYSLGVIYSMLLNLPRNVRFKWDNVIIMGIIPGPKEPKFTINSFLEPHVNELNRLWTGMVFKEKSTAAFYKVALICTSSDVPATRMWWIHGT